MSMLNSRLVCGQASKSQVCFTTEEFLPNCGFIEFMHRISAGMLATWKASGSSVLFFYYCFPLVDTLCSSSK